MSLIDAQIYFNQTICMSFVIDTAVGIATSTTSLFCVQPLYALKTARQNQLKLKISPKILWSGYISNAIGDAFNFSLQYHIYKNKDQMAFNHSLIGGILGGFIANASEQFMDRHRLYTLQNSAHHYKTTFLSLHKELGLKFFKKGLLGTTTREVTYNYAWTTGVHSLEEKIKHIFEINHPLLAKVMSSTVAGTCLTAINHPFDTLKSKIHNNTQTGYLRHGGRALFGQDLKIRGFSSTLMALLQESYKGAGFRSGIISLSLMLNGPLITTYHSLIDKKPLN